MKLAYIFNPGRLQRLDKALTGNAPTEFFYGALELAASGHDIRILETDPNTNVHWPCAAFNFLGKNAPVKLDGILFQSTGNMLDQLNDCDVVVGTTGGHAFALAVWQSLGRLHIPIVGIHTGLLIHQINIWRRYSTAFLLKQMQSILFGEAELEPMHKEFIGIRGHVHVNQFGVDISFWTPGPAVEAGYILAVGNDGRRDYPTLIEAAKRIAYQVVILTSQMLPLPLPPNVRHIRGAYVEGVSDTELRDLYRGAACVVVPLKPTLQPSGQSVTLQAMACGRPVVLSDIQGIWSRITVRDGETLLLTPPEDTDRLVHAINRVMENHTLASTLGINARRVVLQNGTIQNFAKNLLHVCRLAVGRRGINNA